MEKAIEQLEKLQQTGNQFTYENFSEKGSYGYPASFTPDWVAWQTRASSAMIKLFGKGSPQDRAMQTALAVRVKGNGPEKFNQCKSYVLGALESAIESLKNDVFGEIISEKAEAPGALSNKVFIVHGHDELAKTELEVFLSEIELETVVLHRQADEGLTIIEKFEKHSDVGYAFILLTPDEIAYLKTEEELADSDRNKEYRARPNVIFEFGFFVGRLGRSSVCCLYTGDVSLPTDVSGMVYKSYKSKIEEIAYPVIKDLEARGYKLA